MQLLGHPNQPEEICQESVSDAGPSHQQQEPKLEASQEIVLLGLVISTTTIQVSHLKEKVAKTHKEAKQLQATSEISLTKLCSNFGGQNNSSKQPIQVTPLFHCHLQALINRADLLAGHMLLAYARDPA